MIVKEKLWTGQPYGLWRIVVESVMQYDYIMLLLTSVHTTYM